MDVLEAMRSARAWRSYTDREVTDDDVKFLIDYARRAGSGHNRQPWTFVALRDRERIDTLASFGSYTTPLTRAPLGLVLLLDENESERRTEHNVFDCGRAAQNLQLAATERGLGICPQGISEREAAAEFLDIPEGKRVLMAFAVGYPTEEDADEIEGVSKEDELHMMGREGVSEILHWERHG